MMKLNKTHLFIILITSLFLSVSLGRYIKEGFSIINDIEETSNKIGDDISNLIKDTTDNTDNTEKNDNSTDNTDNNTQLYNRTQEKFDNYYTGKAGDTVVISPSKMATPPPPPSFPNNDISGIRMSQIPQGQEDLYILKSQVIPPVCPACPTMTSCPNTKPPPPCPPCARCPEPAFECKKVPNYNSSDSRYLPLPVLSDFSQFGM